MLTDNLTNFSQHLSLLERFVTDKDWYDTLAFDMSLNRELDEWVIERLEEATPALRGGELAIFMASIRESTLTSLTYAATVNEPLQRWKAYREAYAKYGILEVIVEASTFSNQLVAQLEARLGKNYLDSLTQIDRMRPSSLTGAGALAADADAALLAISEVTDYLLLKRWQDDQNQFHHRVLYPPFHQARLDFEAWLRQKYPNLSTCKGRSLLALALICEETLVPLASITMLTLAEADSLVASVVGGKAFGLARLQAHGFSVPSTWVIPVPAANAGDFSTILTHLPIGKWAVRSSATVEDNERNSFAGLFVSHLNVGNTELDSAVQSVIESASSPRVRVYTEHFKTEQPLMAVVIQQFRRPHRAGVWMGQSEGAGVLEWVEGDGEKLVSGQVRPSQENWAEAHRSPQQLLAPDGLPVGEYCLRIQAELGAILDLEWCIVDEELFWLQCRPVTRVIEQILPVVVGTSDMLVGVAASPGVAQAQAIFLDDPTDSALWIPGSILVTESTDPMWVPIMMQAAGVVTMQGGVLSHAAIIARELGIPCVTGIADAQQRISNCASVMIDGQAGTVTLLD